MQKVLKESQSVVYTGKYKTSQSSDILNHSWKQTDRSQMNKIQNMTVQTVTEKYDKSD